MFLDGRVFPAEIESVLNSYPSVDESYVFGLQTTNSYDSHICAWVKLKSEETTVEELKTYLRAKLIDRKVPQFYKLASEMPRVANGKIDTYEIMAAFKADFDILT